MLSCKLHRYVSLVGPRDLDPHRHAAPCPAERVGWAPGSAAASGKVTPPVDAAPVTGGAAAAELLH